MSRLRNWVFTLNNYSADDIENLMGCEKWCSYLVYGREVGENGTPHLQGYVEFDKAETFAKVKKLLGGRVHLEERRGTRQQAVEYCKKDGDWESYGTPKSGVSTEHDPSVKNKALRYMDLLKAGKLGEIAEDPDCSFSILKHVKELAALVERPRPVNTDLKINWYWGPTGTGKTRRAYYEACKKSDKVYLKSTNSKWFDGYDSHEYIIFDDLRSSWFEYSYLLKLLDIYPTQVECKGSSRQWMAKEIWVTSPFHPRDMYSGMQERDQTHDSIQQLIRRVHVVEHMPMTPFGCWKEPVEGDEVTKEPDLLGTMSLTQVFNTPDPGDRYLER